MIRAATPEDAPALKALDRAIWSFDHSPARPSDQPFDTEGVLVDERDGVIAGYTKLGALWPLESVNHVREIKALAVSNEHRRQGVGRGLIEAAVAEARAQGARKVTLRVLGRNASARALYAACGFVEEGNLRELFYLEGAYVDDILMSCKVGDSPGAEPGPGHR